MKTWKLVGNWVNFKHSQLLQYSTKLSNSKTKIILLDETKRMEPFSTAKSQWFGRKMARKWLLKNESATFEPFFGQTTTSYPSKNVPFFSSRWEVWFFFWITWFRWVLNKLWTFKVYPVSGEFSSFHSDQSTLRLFSSHLWQPLAFKICIILF